MENNNKQAYLVYTTVDEEKMVDAITGEIINGSVYTIRRPIDIYARNEAEVLKDASKVTFTEQEILELNSIEKVMTISQAEEYVRSIPQLSISNDYTLKSSSFTKSDSRYLINLEFVKLPKSSDELKDAERAMIAAGDYSYVRLTVDAANMDIVRLFQYNKEAERLIIR